jgi:hypothetical protein
VASATEFCGKKAVPLDHQVAANMLVTDFFDFE